MKWKKLCSAVLAGLMLGAILSGCGGTGEFYALLPAEDADTALAPHVVLEPERPSCHVGDWRKDDDVRWHTDLPRKGEYTFRFSYAMPGNYQQVDGWIQFLPENGAAQVETVTFFPTAGENAWDVYGTVAVTASLPKGVLTISVTPRELPPGQDYFIRLRQIEVYEETDPD